MEDGHASVYTVRTNRPPALAALYSNRLRRVTQSAASALLEWAELQRHRLCNEVSGRLRRANWNLYLDLGQARRLSEHA